MLIPALSLFRLHELPFSHFTFPRWQAWLALVAIGLLVGLDPAMRQASPDMPAMPLWAALAFSVVLILLCFPLIVLFLKWWMKRGQRWDGRGDLFNLVAASWLVANVLGAGLGALGVPGLLTLPLWLYSVWVGGNALSGAIPRASLGYSMVGILLSLIPVLFAGGLLMVALGVTAAALGLVPPPQ